MDRNYNGAGNLTERGMGGGNKGDKNLLMS